MQISEHEMKRRALMNKAAIACTDAIDAMTKEHGELTITEWLDVLLTAAQRWNRYALKDEWRGESEDGEVGP
jgi:hypothetical protein